ncbi:hypothetical protein BO443_80057 [Burkholderia orbicola]
MDDVGFSWFMLRNAGLVLRRLYRNARTDRAARHDPHVMRHAAQCDADIYRRVIVKL